MIILHNRHYNESSLNIRIKKECGVNFHKEAKERISLLMLCAPSNRWRPFSDRKENVGLRVFSCFVRFLVKEFGINSEKCIEYGDSQINKPQRGRPLRAELPDVNINTGKAY